VDQEIEAADSALWSVTCTYDALHPLRLLLQRGSARLSPYVPALTPLSLGGLLCPDVTTERTTTSARALEAAEETPARLLGFDTSSSTGAFRLCGSASLIS
jgi:hypothetical protein